MDSQRITTDTVAALEQAIALAGSEAKLGAGCGFSQVAVNKAKRTGSISPEMALGIHYFLGGRVPASRLRPDLWACPEHVPAKPAPAADAAATEVAR